MTGEQLKETINYFAENNICLVSVDARETDHFTVMPNADYLTTPKMIYLRAHGRDANAYIKGKTVHDRLNYNYSGEEIINIWQRLAKFDKEAQMIFAIFNNNRHRQAPDAAQCLHDYFISRFPQKVSMPRRKQPILF